MRPRGFHGAARRRRRALPAEMPKHQQKVPLEHFSRHHFTFYHATIITTAKIEMLQPGFSTPSYYRRQAMALATPVTYRPRLFHDDMTPATSMPD